MPELVSTLIRAVISVISTYIFIIISPRAMRPNALPNFRRRFKVSYTKSQIATPPLSILFYSILTLSPVLHLGISGAFPAGFDKNRPMRVSDMRSSRFRDHTFTPTERMCSPM